MLDANPDAPTIITRHEYLNASGRSAAGQALYEVLVDYQSRTGGGTSWLQMLEFDEDAGMINVPTYSPSLDQYETDADSHYSFAMDFNARRSLNPPRCRCWPWVAWR